MVVKKEVVNKNECRQKDANYENEGDAGVLSMLFALAVALPSVCFSLRPHRQSLLDAAMPKIAS